MWGCKKHWFRLPRGYRQAIWSAYRPGQETDKTPSEEYLRIANFVQVWCRGFNAGEQSIPQSVGDTDT